MEQNVWRSERRESMLRYIAQFVESHGWPPSVQEIQDALDMSSKSLVVYHLSAMVGAGLLHREPYQNRSMRLTDAGRALIGPQKGA